MTPSAAEGATTVSSSPDKVVVRRWTEGGWVYERRFTSNSLMWRPPRFLPGLLPTDPVRVNVEDRVAWHRRGCEAIPSGGRVVVERIRSSSSRTVVADEVPGRPLRRYVAASRLVRGAPRARHGEELGAWLGSLHASAEEPGTTTLDDFAAACSRRVDSAALPPELARAARQAVDLRAQSGRVPTRSLSHGDPSATNVLWDAKRRRWGIIDFEHAALRPGAHDLGCLFANVLVCVFSPASSAPRARELLVGISEGYRASGRSVHELEVGRAAATAWLVDDFVARLRGRAYGRAVIRARSRSVAGVLGWLDAT